MNLELNPSRIKWNLGATLIFRDNEYATIE